MKNVFLGLHYEPQFFIPFGKIERLEEFSDIPSAGEAFNPDMHIVATEKIDGANLGIWIPINGIPSYYSRSGLNADGLYNFKNDYRKLLHFLEFAQRRIQEDAGDEKLIYPANTRGLYLWGEYFGKGINNRIKYDEQGDVVFYDAAIVTDVTTRLNPYQVERVCMDFVKTADRVEKGDMFMEEIRSRFLKPVEYAGACSENVLSDLKNFYKLPTKSEFADDNREGWVVTMFNKNGFYRRWKYKDEKFEDRRIAQSPELQKFKRLFMDYLTDNRAIDLLSKTPEREKLDVLVRALITDAREDFLKDHGKELEGFDEKFKRQVFNAGGTPFQLVKQAIMREKGVAC